MQLAKVAAITQRLVIPNLDVDFGRVSVRVLHRFGGLRPHAHARGSVTHAESAQPLSERFAATILRYPQNGGSMPGVHEPDRPRQSIPRSGLQGRRSLVNSDYRASGSSAPRPLSVGVDRGASLLSLANGQECRIVSLTPVQPATQDGEGNVFLKPPAADAATLSR